MNPCEKPIAELTLSEAASCAWDSVKNAVVAVFDHPGQATILEWLLAIFTAIAILYILTLLMPRR
jgi:hypothetical protein